MRCVEDIKRNDNNVDVVYVDCPGNLIDKEIDKSLKITVSPPARLKDEEIR